MSVKDLLEYKFSEFILKLKLNLMQQKNFSKNVSL